MGGFMASKYDYVDGRLVRFVQEDIEDETAVEAELQLELDEAQNAVNNAVSVMAGAEEQYKAAEELAEAASTILDEARVNKEAAEAHLAKSLDTKQSYVAAVELRNSQPIDEASDGTSEDLEGESESVDLPIRVAAAEG